MRLLTALLITSLAVLLALSSPALGQITIGKYRISGTVEFSADVEIEEVDPVTIPDPYAGWKLDDNTAAYGGFDFTEINSPTFAGGKLGDAFYTTGAPFPRYGRIDNANAGLLVGASTDFPNGLTIAGWVYPTDSPGVFGGRTYLSNNDVFKGLNGSVGWQIGNGLDGFGGGLFPTFRVSSNALSCKSTTALTLDTWNFVCYRWDPDKNNGMDEQEIFVNSSTRTGLTAANPVWSASTRNFNIGSADDHAGSTTFAGRLDAFYIWNFDLTDAQIAELYNGGDGVELPIAVPQDATSFIPIRGAAESFYALRGAPESFIPIRGSSERFRQIIGK